MNTMKRGNLLLAAAFVAATLVGSRLPEEVAWEGSRLAGTPAAACQLSPKPVEDGAASACERETARA